ncbi:MAG TPA: hypothetical protein VFF71_02270 [Luteimonas sp.]|nr:hypothetical protein [Luteimonas sp.]
MSTTRELEQAFLAAAQALGDRMLTDLQEFDPVSTAEIAKGYADGLSLQVAFVVNGSDPRAELQIRNGERFKALAHVGFQVSSARRDN